MIEMKEKASAQRKERLTSVLASLTPTQDFHIICLSLGRLLSYDMFPRRALIPIAELNIAKMCSAARKHKFGGVMGQYVVVGNSTVRKQHAVHQKVGTGFIASERVLFRELNRDVDWIFTNHSPDICAALNRLKAQKPS
jgi:glycerophosphoryl diester phosphodiesterase